MRRRISGRAGEDYTARYLIRHGYTVLARNYLVRGGELDIVAYRFGVVHIVEVKSRSGDTFGTPAEAVTQEKREHIFCAAESFLSRNVRQGKIRVVRLFGERELRVKKVVFDIAEVYMTTEEKVTEFNFIKSAFRKA